MSKRLIDRLTQDQIEAILDTLPLEFIVIDSHRFVPDNDNKQPPQDVH